MLLDSPAWIHREFWAQLATYAPPPFLFFPFGKASLPYPLAEVLGAAFRLCESSGQVPT